MHVLLLNPPRRRSKRRRSRRRNYSHWIPAYAKNKGRRRSKRRNYSHWIPAYAENKGRRRSKRRRSKRRNYSHWIPAYAENKGRRRRRRRNYYTPRMVYNRGRRRRRNPGGIVGAMTAGLDPSTIAALFPAAAGAVLNAATTNWVASLPLVPNMLKAGMGRTVLSLASAGATSVSVFMLSGLAPKLVRGDWAGPVFAGGVIATLADATREFLIPAASAAIKMSGLGDFLSVSDLARRQPLGDYATPRALEQAKPLGSPLEAIAAEEIAGLV